MPAQRRLTLPRCVDSERSETPAEDIHGVAVIRDGIVSHANCTAFEMPVHDERKHNISPANRPTIAFSRESSLFRERPANRSPGGATGETATHLRTKPPVCSAKNSPRAKKLRKQSQIWRSTTRRGCLEPVYFAPFWPETCSMSTWQPCCRRNRERDSGHLLFLIRIPLPTFGRRFPTFARDSINGHYPVPQHRHFRPR